MSKFKNSGQFKKGCIPWIKGKKGIFTAWNKGLTKKDPRIAKAAKEHSKKMKGRKSPLRGKKYTEEQKKNILKGENRPDWKGDNVSYSELHNWIRRKRGTPNYCEQCKRTDRKRYDWANIDDEYKRNLSDYMRLCRSCHLKYDRNK